MAPKISFFLIICFLLNFSFNTWTAKATWVQSGFWYAGSEFPVPQINSALYTHLVFAFAYINSSSYELRIAHSHEPDVSTFTQIVSQKNPSVKTILSIWAGREESPNFFSMLNQSSNRRSFIKTSIKAAREYGFHGLDLFGVIPNTDSNMATFMDEWRAAINSESESSGTPRLILTMGAYYSPVLDAMAYPVDSIVRNFDWIHLMSYDYYLPTKDNFTGAHAALYDPFSNLNTDYGIKEWIKKRFPANKLTIGLPFHGYAWTLVNPKDNTVGSPAKGWAITTDGAMSYRFIKFYNNSYNYKATSAYNPTYVMNYFTVESFWIGYDDVEAIKTKVSYAKEKGLLGYTVFQVPNDDNNWSLSRAAQGIEEDQHDRKKSKLAIVLPAGTVAAFLLCIAIYCVAMKTIRSKGSRKLNQRSVDPNLEVFTFAQMQAATDNFSFQNKLGEGGYGPVYKGKLPNGQEIAVKRLSQSSKQGVEEFQNEVTLTVKLQHVNLLRIQGFCTEREEKMLIYDYMPNKSLDFYLYGL
nr:G-type lectin S-receptor-like serine/threonine-protein kinase [Ipomoea batatas]